MKMTASLLVGAIVVLVHPASVWCQDTEATQVVTQAETSPPITDAPVAVPEAGRSEKIPPPQPLAGYSDYNDLTHRLDRLADSRLIAELSSLGTTREGREIWLLTLGSQLGIPDPQPTKPAMLIVGNVQASHLLGSQLAVMMAEQLISEASKNDDVGALLNKYTLYFIPSPTPDATEKNFAIGQREYSGNSVVTDDDRDFALAEDPPVDLDGNGFITMMRIEDSLGTHRSHPDDPRIMIQVDPKKNEVGTHRLMVESQDSDQDGQFGEDAGDGVDLNRNFTFDYDYFGKQAGVNQVSEIETRALVDFCFDHPNIVAVLSFSNQDNLFHPWKPSTSGDAARIKSSILSADAPYASYAAERFQELHGGKNAPESVSEKGSFVDWAYYHYGRWSFATRGWWIPEVKAAVAADAVAGDAVAGDAVAADAVAGEPSAGEPVKKKEATEKRGQADINALRWMASQSLEGFAAWTVVDHPDFQGKVVEVGGFIPWVRSVPPAAELDKLVKPHVDFLIALGGMLPRIEFRDPQVKSLGSNFFEIEVDLVNTAYLPTMCEMGSVNGEAYPIVVQFELPEGTELIQGERKTLVRKLDGQGGKRALKWLVRFDSEADELHIPLSAAAPTIHSTHINIEVKR